MYSINAHNEYGYSSEQLAASHLKSHGYKIICQNYFTQYGELDIVANIDDILVFCEVKARHKNDGFEIITRAKTRRCCRAAMLFLSKYPDFECLNMRFDLIHIVGKKIHEHLIGAWDCA